MGLDSAEFKSGLSQAEKQFRSTQRNFEAIGKKMQTVGRNLSLAVTAPLTALGVASFKAASDAFELQSAFDQTFGTMAADMTKWAKATGDAMGRSTQEIEEGANAFGLFFNQAAPTKQAAADLSKQFTVLAQDLSSFFNVSPEVALQKLRSGLSGEAEPLRDFGVFLNEAAVGQKALQMGLAKTTKELTDQDKILARAALILEATKNAQGDVARTADGTANRIRAAKAAFEEMEVAIGQKLIPALTPLISALTRALNAFNQLPAGVQTGVVVFAGLAAALGPVFYVMSNVTKAIAPLVAGVRLAAVTAAAAGAQFTTLGLAVQSLRGLLLASLATIAPYAAALAGLALIYYALKLRAGEAAKASASYTKAQQDAADGSKKAAGYAETLATATGKVRAETIAAAKADREAAKQKLASARASLVLAQAELARLKVYNSKPDFFATDPRIASLSPGAGGKKAEQTAALNVASAKKTIATQEATIKQLTGLINSSAPPTVATPGVGGGHSGRGGGGPTGPSAAEIEQRFNDELANYAQQTLSARQQLATSAEDRAELELRGVELARVRTLEGIEQDKDYSEVQKQRLKQQVEALADAERAGVEFQKQLDLERQASDQLQTAFDQRRDMLQLDASLADTQQERKDIALQILALEQEYRRNQLEMVVASKTASDAEKKRAQAVLDSLDAVEAKETASVSRGNETDVERYLRDLNKSPAQINEAIDQIKINGLENLSNALVDAIVNFKSLADVAKSVVKQVLAELLKLQIQQAIIKPLAGALGLGGVPGHASGVRASVGGLAWVGERGRELVNLPSGTRVFPHGQSESMARGMQGGDTHNWNVTVVGAMSDREARRTGSQIASGAQQRMAQVRRSGLAG